MKYKCPQCDYEKDVSSRYAGKRVRCPKCKMQSIVQAADDSKNLVTGFQKIDASASSIDFSAEFSGDFTNELSQSEVAPPTAQTASPAPRAPLAQTVSQYEVNAGALKTTVSYACPSCSSRLVSSLSEAGGTDVCPDCSTGFIVPGEKEQLANRQERRKESQRKAVERERRTKASSKAVVDRVAEKQQKQEEVQLARDPMFEWYIYAVVLLALLTFAAGRYLLDAVMTDTSYLCVMIVALFLLGSALNFLGMRRLRNEYVCAAECMNNLKRHDGLTKVCQGPAAGIFHQHVMDLGKIARHDSNFTQDSLVTLLYSRMMAKSKMVDILAGVLVTLGLIGTIVGLISMTDGLSTTLSSLGDDGEASEMLSGMRSTMSGLGTAFNTTLVGAILGSVVLRILNNVYTSNVDHLVTYVASTTEVNIVPQLKRQARKSLEAAA